MRSRTSPDNFPVVNDAADAGYRIGVPPVSAVWGQGLVRLEKMAGARVAV